MLATRVTVVRTIATGLPVTLLWPRCLAGAYSRRQAFLCLGREYASIADLVQERERHRIYSLFRHYVAHTIHEPFFLV